MIDSEGLLGVSTHTSRVSSRQAASRASWASDVGRGVVDTRRSVDAFHQPEGSSVGVEGQDQVIAGSQQRPQHGVLGGQSTGEGVGVGGAFQRRHLLLPVTTGTGSPNGRTRTSDRRPPLLPEGGGQVHGGHHRPGDRVGILAGMDGTGFEAVAIRGVSMSSDRRPIVYVVASGRRGHRGRPTGSGSRPGDRRRTRGRHRTSPCGIRPSPPVRPHRWWAEVVR